MAGRVLGAIAVAATAGLTVLALAIPASAHTPDVKAKCVKDEAVLTVNLSAYAQKDNTILVKDGEEVLEDAEFGKSYSKTFTKAGDVEHTFSIAVKASDSSKFDYKKTVKTEKCVKTPPSSSITTPPSQTSSSVPVPSSETPVPSTTVPPAPGAGAEPPLAATGASTTWTLLAGLGLVGAGAAALILVRRKRA